jgi:hypothetical protein
MKKFVIPFLALAALIVAGFAYASIPDSNGVIHGCVKSNSMVRIIDDSSQTCASGELSLNWNQTGPQGPQGVPGPTSLSYEYVYHNETVTNVGNGGMIDASVSCSSLDEIAVGGGGSIDDSSFSPEQSVNLVYSEPQNTGSVGSNPSGWSVQWRFKATDSSQQSEITLRAVVICLRYQ